jgi:hypothetical protein
MVPLTEGTSVYTSPGNIDIIEFDIQGDRDTGTPTVSWRTEGEFTTTHSTLTTGAGDILIELAVDGDIDVVSTQLGQTADLVALDRAIETLRRLRDGLTAMYPEGQTRAGRCLVYGDWGRCTAENGHEDAHAFPSEAEWRRSVLPDEARK